jgi:hypothetical protein
MGVARARRHWLTAGVLVALSLEFTLLVAPAASAGTLEDPTVTAAVTGGRPMVLASTGLDITVPVVIGLAVLVLGTVMVGWAFLATGRRGQHH